ncbi:MAG: phospholipase [Granulosicoccus sp.]|nr:phospholipase [Granulosicoccus sp.]
MADSKTWRRLHPRKGNDGKRRGGVLRPLLWGSALLYICLTAIVRALVPPPQAIGLQGAQYNAEFLRFHHDDSWLDEFGNRHLSQELFDEVFTMIGQAETFILLDMFLFNAWQGPVPESHRALSTELTDALIAQKKRYPSMRIILITDPINTVYGGLRSPHIENLRNAQINVVLTDLSRLQDSNPAWSGFWRLAISPFGNSESQLLPNPFGQGRVSLRSYLALFNFKANHRKLLVADHAGETLHAYVGSANPHDGSSAHRNVGVSFSGPAVLDLLDGERELLKMSSADSAWRTLDEWQAEWFRSGEPESNPMPAAGAGEAAILAGSPRVQVLSESRIHDAVLAALEQAGSGDAIALAMFYLSDRQIIQSLKAASSRGASVRVMLDVNTDAFGRQKNGVPNRPVAAELVSAGMQVRWCATTGEQCHAKWLHVSLGSDPGSAPDFVPASRRASTRARPSTSMPAKLLAKPAERTPASIRDDDPARAAGEHVFVLGSANFTRRNLLDLNMETSVLIRTAHDDVLADEMIEFFDDQWNNRDGRIYTRDYAEHADDSLLLTLQYRLMEWSGLSTF